MRSFYSADVAKKEGNKELSGMRARERFCEGADRNDNVLIEAGMFTPRTHKCTPQFYFRSVMRYLFILFFLANRSHVVGALHTIKICAGSKK
ncbi:hypothetical protein CDAR_62621 [Caerostris darwini]|uniref:Uncharacterized protein n=1 Tax=Caerostris darwini TaxID=1538125 RepID=A0AAV4UF91_9ARAC|nr:hypothetical protein CDAR_62621 [Caerostris darwini]